LVAPNTVCNSRKVAAFSKSKYNILTEFYLIITN
jgi:hypothetical protein